MGAKRTGEEDVRVITQNGSGTYSVSLPIKVVRNLRWRQGQKVVVEQKGKTIVIMDWKK